MICTSQRQSHKQNSFADELLSMVVSLLHTDYLLCVHTKGKCVYNDCCYAITQNSLYTQRYQYTELYKAKRTWSIRLKGV